MEVTFIFILIECSLYKSCLNRQVTVVLRKKENKTNYIHPDNLIDMNSPDKKGNTRHWILEIHFVDRERQIGGFYEQLLIPVS